MDSATEPRVVRPAKPASLPDKRPGKTSRHGRTRIVDILIIIGASAPLLVAVYDTASGNLAAEPVKDLTHRTGWWALVMLLASLAVTPLRRLTGKKQLVRHRRTIGLFAFFYATLHVLIYFGLDHFFALDYIVEDIVERPFITVGFAAWLILVPLAATSTRRAKGRLGRRWQTLHRLVYLSAALAVLHFFWLVKADVREPAIFAAILAVLLLFRIPAVTRFVDRRFA